MLLQSIISQSNSEQVFEEQPNITWGASNTGDYPTLSGVTKVDIFVPTISLVETYNHNSTAIYHNGRIHLMHKTGKESEDGAGNWIRYTYSDDLGLTWASYQVLFDSPDDITRGDEEDDIKHLVPCCWVVLNDELYAVVETNRMFGTYGSKIRLGHGAKTRKINSNGTFDTIYWIENVDGTLTAPSSFVGYEGHTFNSTLRSQLREVMINNWLYRPTRYYSVPDNDPLNTWRTYYDGNQLVEPYVSLLPQGNYIKLSRAQTVYTDIKIAQTSNYGIYWSEPFETQIPDMPSATNILMFRDMVVGIVGNNFGTNRANLYLALSNNGFNYSSGNIYNIDKATDLIADFSGNGKGGGCQYPSTIELPNGKVFCVYSIRKEAIRCAIFDKPTLI